MKVLIVSIGILLLFTEFMVFQSDMNRYVTVRDYVTQTAWNCVEGINGCAILGSGDEAGCTFNEAYVEDELRFWTEAINTGLKNTLTEPAEIELELFDSANINNKSLITGRTIGRPTIVLRIRAKTKDFFRLPVFSVTDIGKTVIFQVAG